MLLATRGPFPNMFLLLNKIKEPGRAQVDKTNTESKRNLDVLEGEKCFSEVD